MSGNISDRALIRRLEEMSIFDDTDDMYDDGDEDSFRTRVINKIKEFCIRMGLEADSFMDKYETYEMRNKTQIRTIKDLDMLFASIRSELQEQSDKRASNTVKSNLAKIKMKKEEEIAGSKTASELFSFAAPGDFKEQPQLLETLFKSDAMDVVDESEEGMRAAKAPIVEVVQPVPEYFYMNESLEAKGRWLEALMERAKSDDIPYTPEEEENLGDEEVYTRTSKFNIPVQDDIMAFGRICYEEPEEDGLAPKMTPVNTLLQGPLSIGSPRVKLILSK